MMGCISDLPFAHDSSIANAPSSLSGEYNTGYTAHFICSNWLMSTSYSLKTLYAIVP